MKIFQSISLWVCILSLAFLITIRAVTVKDNSIANLKVTTWDALGYYLYLPGTFIYHDLKQLSFYPAIQNKYDLTGNFYQARRYESGNYVMKYLSGIAVMYSPFFFLAHFAAPYFHYPQDGFSPPYQLAVCFASLFYSLLALLVLRKVLLYYFSETVTAITLLLVSLATNFPQYAAVECGMTHSYLFALYSFQLFVTIQWYRTPKLHWALASGILIGLAAITRPTDAVMLLIPLLWNEADRAASRAKWQLVKEHKMHVLIAILGAFCATLPQLIYWKYVTGHWVFDVGSKWVFLNPYWRVLFGFTNGWLIYTPVVAFFFIGMLLLKGQPFKRSVIVFFLINIWIIISWDDWRYGGTYSCRALVQSYPVLALALASSVAWCMQGARKYFFSTLWIYLLAVNIFQLYQYHTGIIHYNRMNKAYYEAIYLNPHPSPLDMSLLDTDERLYDDSKYNRQTIYELNDTLLKVEPGRHLLRSIPLLSYCADINKDYWIKVNMNGITNMGLWQSSLNSDLVLADTTNSRMFVMDSPLNNEKKQTRVCFYQHVKPPFNKAEYRLSLSNTYPMDMKVTKLEITVYSK